MNAELTSPEARLIGVEMHAMREDVIEVKAHLQTISQALTTLAKLQAEHAETRSAIDRAFTQINKVDDRVSDIDKRVQKIEILIPGLVEARKWVVGIGVGAVVMLMIALASLVLIKTPAPQPAPSHAPVLYGVNHAAI